MSDRGGGLVRVAPVRVGLVRFRLDIAYDGTDFSGWAAQPGRRTVAGVLTEALTRVVRAPVALTVAGPERAAGSVPGPDAVQAPGPEAEAGPVPGAVPVALTVAGRTDAGVHATGQVAHVDLPAVPELRRVNGVLPPDVRVLAATVVPGEFDARFSALWRRYAYRICDGVPNPLRRRYVLARPRTLDVEAMARAAVKLVGEHDFVAFCRRREGATTVRRILSFDVTRDGGTAGAAAGESAGGREIVCTVQADAFCHSMVRSLVGALLAVGEGARDDEWPASLLTRAERAGEVTVAPAHGLTLLAVGYPPDNELAARATQTRRPRT